MAGKKRFQYRRKGRRRYRRKRRADQTRQGYMGTGSALLTVNKGLGFPLRFRTKLRYVESFQLKPLPTGIMSTYVFTCNDIFDPNHTTTGHQPFYYDQITLIYNNWKVLGSKISLDIIPNGTAVQAPIRTACWIDDDGTYNYTFVNALEHGRLKNFRQTGGQVQSKPGRLTNTWSLKKQFKDKYTAAQVCGSQTTSPNLRQFYMIGFEAVDQTSEPSYQCVATIDYIVDFFNLNDLPSS